MQDTTDFRTNRDLFSNHYLDDHLRDTDVWESVDSAELQEAYDDILDLWERERDLVADRNEPQLEEKFIRPMFRKLDIPFEVEESVEQGQRRPDYGFFESDEGARNAFTRRRDGGDFYKNAVAVADAKRWGRKLDTRGEQQRDFENPSYQIHVYLQETPATWAVLTNGEYWRLYYGPTSHRLDSYYEIDLPAVLESDDLDAFKYFYLFFQHEAFLPDASGDCFLDDVYSESNVFAEELGEDLQDNIYDAIQSLAEGFLTYPENDLNADDLDLIHDSSLIYLYRLIFVLYAESEGRDLLNTDNEIYEQSYSLNTIKQEVAEELDSDSPSYQSWQDDLWDQIDELFQLIDQGSASRGIPEEDLHIPAYNGGLFRTNPASDDSPEAEFLAANAVGDEYLARVIELLTRSRTGSSGKIFVDYSSLDVRHLGSIYEGLLEYQLNVADEPLTLDDGEYVLADGGATVAVEPGEVYLTTDAGERKATGSYYTPEYVVEYIVENTLGPLVEDIREDLAGNVSYDDDDESGFAEEFAERIFELKILDPAMGSGHFLTNTIDYLAREIIDAQERQAEQQGVETVAEGQDINWARRQVAQHCIYGVDVNPLAVELAKVSLWLRTLAAEQPLAFLDHHLKTGNSLVGSDIEDIDELETGKDETRPDSESILSEYMDTKDATIERLMSIYEDFIAIENRELADVKEMERRYHEIERDDLRTRLIRMANVKAAEDFGLDLHDGVYDQMAQALESDDKWTDLAETNWFENAQMVAKERSFFHWKLAFPEVFYQESGDKLSNGGFDVILGNPPYSGISGDLKDYLEPKLEGTKRNWDTYTAFVERLSHLTKNGGTLGFIIPNTHLIGPWYTDFRTRMIQLSSTISVLSFGGEKIFSDATVFTSIWISKHSGSSCNVSIAMEDSVDQNIPNDPDWYSLDTDEMSDLWVYKNDIIRKAEDNNQDLSYFCNSYDSGMDYNRASVRNKVFYEGNKQHVADQGWLKGGDIERYYHEFENRYIRHDWSEQLSGSEYLKVNEDAYKKSPKILTRQTGDEIISTVDEEEMYIQKSLHSTNAKPKFEGSVSMKSISCVLNSFVSSYFYREYTRNERGKALSQVKIDRLKRVPMSKELADSDKLEDIFDQINDMKEKMYLEVDSFLTWISREWDVSIDNLSLKTNLRKYWKHDFDEMMRIAKKNGGKIAADPSSRRFQDQLRSEWQDSIDVINPILDSIESLETDVDVLVLSSYNLDSLEVERILDSSGVEGNRRDTILSEFE